MSQRGRERGRICKDVNNISPCKIAVGKTFLLLRKEGVSIHPRWEKEKQKQNLHLISFCLSYPPFSLEAASFSVSARGASLALYKPILKEKKIISDRKFDAKKAKSWSFFFTLSCLLFGIFLVPFFGPFFYIADVATLINTPDEWNSVP